ncbi:MAG: helix-turn-helix transcriptional regulator [Clostridia bacterium]|nr:helix-turn-helix transcriptional regulator [Clostridia bacterium]
MKNLKKLRLERNLTQEDVSKIINKSAVAYGYYESGRSEPPIDLLLKLADFFGCSVDYLIGHQTKELLHLDSFTPMQQSLVKMVKQLSPDQTLQVVGYVSGMLNIPFEQTKPNRPW